MTKIDSYANQRPKSFRGATRAIVAFLLLATATESNAFSAEPVFVWPDLAPGETTRETGTTQPNRKGEDPPITRVTNIRRPTLAVFLPEKPNGTAILILPGGGFGKVVPDMEGSEAAPFLNRLGIAVFVLSYRTNETKPADESSWRRPLQDAQRTMRLIRSKAAEWKIQPDRVGVLGFSAGGQVGSILHTAVGKAAYKTIDAIDKESYRPDFSLLIYPWQILDNKTKTLLPEIRLTEKSSPAFLVHTHDDRSSSIGSILFYVGLKQHNVSAELHIYENGGHGYGMRARKASNIGTWPDRATDWLIRRGLGRPNHPAH
jgi:acetyl esterase/lipase